MKNLVKWIRHNQGVFLSLSVVIGVMVWTFGCQSSVTSLLDPGKMISGPELEIELAAEVGRLEAELDLLFKQAALKREELARQDAIKKKLFDFAAITVEGSTVNPAGLMGLAFSVLGIGAVVDNRLKDKVIKNRPLPVKAKEA